jgi:hypothetical protein
MDGYTAWPFFLLNNMAILKPFSLHEMHKMKAQWRVVFSDNNTVGAVWSGQCMFYFSFLGHAARGAVVEALCYKPEGRGIDSRWCLWNFN